MLIAVAGVRRSPRVSQQCNYDVDSLSDFPQLVGRVAPHAAKLCSPFPVVELTEHNDPLKGRVIEASLGNMSSDELEAMLTGQEMFERLGGLETTVGEWALSLELPKDERGKQVMHQIHDIARCPVEAPAYIGEVGTDPLFLQRRLDPRALGWYGLVEDNGWCGWVMLEWFDRLRRNTTCERLVLTSPRDRACLAAFIAARLLVVTHVPTKTVLQKCLVRLREHRFRPLAPGDEIKKKPFPGGFENENFDRKLGLRK